MMNAIRRAFTSLALATLASGCITGQPMTPAEIEAHGTARFSAPTTKVFAAAQGALKSEGYQVAIADRGKGLIKTNRKLVRAIATGNAYSAQAVEITRQYVLTLRADGGSTVVVAEPRVFRGDQDLSGEKVWDLESSAGERKLWSQLFVDIKEAL